MASHTAMKTKILNALCIKISVRHSQEIQSASNINSNALHFDTEIIGVFSTA